MAAAAARAQREAEGGVEAQQVVVGITEEVQQHLQAWGTGLWGGTDGGLLLHPPPWGAPSPVFVSLHLSLPLYPSDGCRVPWPRVSLCVSTPMSYTRRLAPRATAPQPSPTNLARGSLDGRRPCAPTQTGQQGPARGVTVIHKQVVVSAFCVQEKEVQ